MKNPVIVFCICLLTFLFSCRKDHQVSGSAYIKMEIGGDARQWEADRGIVIGTSYIDGKHNLTITGTDQNFDGASSGLSIVFSQTAEIGVGNYVLNSSSDGGGTITKVNGKTYGVGKAVPDIAMAIEITGVTGSGNAKRFKGRFQGQMRGATFGDNIGVTGEFSSL